MATTVSGRSLVTHVQNRNSPPVTDSSRKPTVNRFGAPPRGVAAPPTLVPHATASPSAVPKRLDPRSSIPMNANMATTMGIIAAATTVFGRTVLSPIAMQNQTTTWRLRFAPSMSSDASAMRRSRPQRVHTVARMFAPSSRMISTLAYAGRTSRTGTTWNTAAITSGRKACHREVHGLSDPPPRHPK